MSPVTSAARVVRAGLTARTVRVDAPDLDLLRFAGDHGLLFERDGVGLAGRGVAVRCSPHEAAAVLAAIDTDDEVQVPGTGPVAIGALPFEPEAAGTVVVPRTVVGRAGDGTAWITVVGEGAATELAPEPAPSPGDRPDGFTLRSSRSHRDWCRVVAQAVDAIRAGGMDKVVLAREVVVEANRPIQPADVLGRLRALYPSCTVFSVEGFLGASPETLVERTGERVRAHPLAGTIPRSGDPAADARMAAAFLASEKERHEHRLVVEQVAERMRSWCTELAVPEVPSIVPLRNVCHLGTELTGTASASAPSALGLALHLHPTPAVAGTPTAEAMAWIAAFEGLERGRYAGPVGWVDAKGNGRWAVGIRSAEVDGHRARLMAGVGVVADSDPDAELAETQLKLQALLAAVVRP